MKKTLKKILDKSGQKATVSFKNKEKRKSFDESFGKQKMEEVSKRIGGDQNSLALAKKLAEA
jgi:hypothetical protein